MVSIAQLRYEVVGFFCVSYFTSVSLRFLGVLLKTKKIFIFCHIIFIAPNVRVFKAPSPLQ